MMLVSDPREIPRLITVLKGEARRQRSFASIKRREAETLDAQADRLDGEIATLRSAAPATEPPPDPTHHTVDHESPAAKPRRPEASALPDRSHKAGAGIGTGDLGGERG